MKGKYLITTDSWFIAPDGKQYRAVWGDVRILEDAFLGLKTNRNSSNWFAMVGTESNHVIIAGCQIHYAVMCETKPEDGLVKDYSIKDTEIGYYERPSAIYIAS